DSFPDKELDLRGTWQLIWACTGWKMNANDVVCGGRGGGDCFYFLLIPLIGERFNQHDLNFEEMEALSVDFLKKLEQFTQQPANLGYLGKTTKVEAQLEITLFLKEHQHRQGKEDLI
ncbi:hypothetical protein C5167_015182, partial [Papaver somniferum]